MNEQKKPFLWVNKNVGYIMMNTENKRKEITKYSDLNVVQQKAYDYLGSDGTIYFSYRRDKKFMVFNPNTNRFVHFGQYGFEDYTKHKDEDRRMRYLKRAMNIKGNWKGNPYSANNLSINILW